MMAGKSKPDRVLAGKAPKSIKPSIQEIYEHLRLEILDHSIPPATRINIDLISKKLGVSATPVREALRLLQGDNLLVATSNKGYATTPVLDVRGVRELFEFRLLIEPWAARTAAANRLQNPAQKLMSEISSFDSKSASIHNAMIKHDVAFHRTILISAENNAVLQSFDQSHCHLHLFRMFREDWDWKATLSQHKEIAEAIADVDPDAAEKSMQQHLKSAYTRFVADSPDEKNSLNNLDFNKSASLVVNYVESGKLK
jgi:DNA-binding GntR family transcriptional regulator